MSRIVDYSAGRVGAALVAQAGFVGAIRYVGFPARTKCVTADEVTDYLDHGLGIALVFEDDIYDWRTGYTGGQSHARIARAHADTVGFPQDLPIYMAVDSSITSISDQSTVLDYLNGAANVLGGAAFVGVYGSADVCDFVRVGGEASWFWQTSAWSGGRHTTAHLYQRIDTIDIAGIQCDINDVLAANWGQYQKGSPDMLSQDDVNWIADTVLARTVKRESPAGVSDQDINLHAVAAWWAYNTDGVAATLADLVGKVQAGGVDYDLLAGKVAALIGPAVASSVVDEVMKRLEHPAG